MLIAAGETKQGRKLLVIGLEAMNMQRLAGDQPIYKNLADAGVTELAEWDITILGPEDLARFIAATRPDRLGELDRDPEPRLVSSPATLGQFRESVQASYRRIGRGLRRPDDDWPNCVLFVQTDAGVELAELPSSMLQYGRDKQVLVTVMREALRRYRGGVIRFVLVVNTHAAAFPENDAAREELIARIRHEEIRVEDLPNAREFLWLVVGDAETEEHWQANIRRDARRPPTLSPWRQLEDDDVELSGRFVGLHEALRG